MSKQNIVLGSVSVPLAAYATQANAILGIKGSGKTTTAKGIAEQLLDHDIPIVVLDPVGMWRYLKVPKEKGGKAYKVVVAGGQSPDLPLTPHTAPEIVRSAIRSNIPLVIDLYDRNLSKADWRRIVKATCDILMFENKGIRHLFLEEAAEYIPQVVRDGELFASVEKLCRMGGNASVGITLINPRAQEVNKAVLELCELLILQRQKGSHAMAALKKWLTMAQDMQDVEKTIAGLATGEGLVWPESATPVRTIFPPSITFHPDRKRPDLPRGSMPEDVSSFVGELKESLTKVLEEAKANDPAELKKQLAKLQAELRNRDEALARMQKSVKPAEVPIFTGEDLKSWKTFSDLLSESLWKQEKLIIDTQSKLDTFLARLEQTASRPKADKFVPSRGDAVRAAEAKLYKRIPVSSDTVLPKGEAAILSAIAQFNAQSAVSRETLTVLTGYKRSSRDTYLQRLREKGYIEEGREGLMATDAGIAALGSDYQPLPTGKALQDHWLQRLPQGEKVILEVLLAGYPEWIDRERISESTNYQRSSRDTYLQRLGARMLIETDRGTVRASKILFDE